MHKIFLLSFLLLIGACTRQKKTDFAREYTTYCGSCHLVPNINSLTKGLWDTVVLPEMGARLGMANPNYNPLAGLNFGEQEAVLKSGIYPPRPQLDADTWEGLVNYILQLAPDSLEKIPISSPEPTAQFKPVFHAATGGAPSYTHISSHAQKVYLAGLKGSLLSIASHGSRQHYNGNSPLTGIVEKNGIRYYTEVGILDPSEQARGMFIRQQNKKIDTLATGLHRPVFTIVEDLNRDGNEELVIAEFGHHTGALTLVHDTAEGWQKKVLMAAPGAVKIEVTDLNADGLPDMLVLFAQGDERLMAFYQEEGLNFRGEILLRFSPASGSSWFEWADLNGDGYKDLVTAHGDNADGTYIPKPYHGIRIHLNDGKLNFKTAYSYPMYGATRVLAEDWDRDGDIDLAAIAAFPDYTDNPQPFVYLENQHPANLGLESATFDGVDNARWFLMASADWDGDGDKDLILTPFNYLITPVPESTRQQWQDSNIDFVILNNQLIP